MFVTISVYISLVIITFILLYFHLTRHFNYWKNQNVPYVKPIPFFGNILKVCLLKETIGQFVSRIHRTTNSPYLGFFVFDQPFLLIRDPQLIKLFLVKDFDSFDDRSVIENRRDDEMGSNILFIIKNPAWRHIRTKLTPAFSTGKLKHMLPLMVEAGEGLEDYLNNIAIKENSTDTREICMRYSTDVISSCAFGINAQSFKHDDAEFRTASRRVFEWTYSRSIHMTSYFFAPILVKLFKLKFLDPPSAKFMRKVFWKTITERKASDAYRGDLIDVLIQIQKQTDGSDFKLDEDKLVAQAAQYFIAGNESSGSTISYTLYELSLNPSLQDRLRGEIKSTLKKHGEISYELLREMTYLDMVVNETLRKYPVLPFLDRRCTKTYKIPGTDIVIKKGMPIYIALQGLHFDPQYFPEPEKYDPERFSLKNKQSIPPYTFMPFGEGHHNCIGARFAMLSSKIGLIRILSKFEVELSEDTPVPLNFDTKGILITPKHGLPLHFKSHVDTSVE